MKSFNRQKQITGRKSWAAFLLFIIFIFLVSSCSDNLPLYPSAQQNGSNVEIDISELVPEVPSFYTYSYKGKKINYFVILIGKNVNSYIDACASCFPYKMGFRYSSGRMICNHSQLELPVHKIEFQKAQENGTCSCYPVMVEGKIEKEKYIITVKRLEKKSGLFLF